MVTPSAAVAAWAGAGWRVAGDLGSSLGFAPAVLHLGEREARAMLAAPSPELAFFAAWAMQARHGPAASEIVLAALRRVEAVADPALKKSLGRSILAVLSDALRRRCRP